MDAESRCGRPDSLGLSCLLSQTHYMTGSQCMGFRPSAMKGAIVSKPLDRVQFTRVDERATVPTRAHEGDAGWDLYCLESFVIKAGTFKDVHTGIRLGMPPEIWARVVGRSSTMRNHGLLVIEGIIDSGYRGDMFFGLRNIGFEAKHIAAGTRLAQLIFHRHTPVNLVEVRQHELDDGDRGTNGFGSTGT